MRDIIAEPLETYHVCGSREETTLRALELMRSVGIPAEFLNRYPHQFSGGQRQRIGIARAIALQPDLIVCDEPVSALDVSVQSHVLNLLKDLQEQYHLTYLFIGHDLPVINFIADRVCVMFLGHVCEIAPKEALYRKPLHPYTSFLLDAIPKADPHLRSAHRKLLAAQPGESTQRLLLPHPLPLRHGALPHRKTGAESLRRPHGRLPPDRRSLYGRPLKQRYSKSPEIPLLIRGTLWGFYSRAYLKAAPHNGNFGLQRIFCPIMR